LRYDGDTSPEIFKDISRSLPSLRYQLFLLQPEQRTLVDKSGMIRVQMGSTIDQKMVAVAWDALYDTTP
jgi:hypothetical protein